MLAAVGAAKLTGVRSFASADDTHVAAAGLLAVDGAIELDLEADEVAVDHVELSVHDCGSCLTICTSRYCLVVRSPTRMRLRRAASAICSALRSTQQSTVFAPLSPVVMIRNTACCALI